LSGRGRPEKKRGRDSPRICLADMMRERVTASFPADMARILKQGGGGVGFAQVLVTAQARSKKRKGEKKNPQMSLWGGCASLPEKKGGRKKNCYRGSVNFLIDKSGEKRKKGMPPAVSFDHRRKGEDDLLFFQPSDEKKKGKKKRKGGEFLQITEGGPSRKKGLGNLLQPSRGGRKERPHDFKRGGR